MTREQTIECIRVMQGYVDGNELEILSPFGKWERATAPRWQWDDTDYRIKPTATLRPWTADEVPLGAWIRYKRALHDRSILAWTSNQADRDMWMDEREHSIDGGKNWLPCGGRGGVEMNDHIPDPTKMISATPRMDASAHDDGAIWETGCDIERELNEIERLTAVRLSYIKLIEAQNDAANDRIKRLEEQLMDAKNKHAVLVADVVLNEDRAERIKRLEDRIHRAAMAFFRDGSDGQVASGMLSILEEERGKP